MTHKKYLSNKKTSLQTISISPALREWIIRYVNVMHKKHPDDERYKSISAFYCNVMEKAMEIFESGKTLEDFERLPDKGITEFYDKITFKAVIPHFEQGISMNKYTYLDFKSTPMLFLKFRNFLIKNGQIIDYADYQKKITERFRNFMISNNLTKDFHFEVTSTKGIIEYTGYYQNLHFDLSKAIAGIMGTLGLKLINLFYSEKDIYTRFDFTRTDLFERKDIAFEERRTLFDSNLKFFINYANILEEESYYLWIILSKNNNLVIDFEDNIVLRKYLKDIEQDILKYGIKDEIPLKILKFFERLHWLIIEDSHLLKFKIQLSEKIQTKIEELVLESLLKYGKLRKENEFYFLEI